jgi:hypothetical protein
MIVDAFTESLEIGLESPGQVVVSITPLILSCLVVWNRSLTPAGFCRTAYDPHFRIRVAEWS